MANGERIKTNWLDLTENDVLCLNSTLVQRVSWEGELPSTAEDDTPYFSG